MSILSPQQVESVKRWLDDQPGPHGHGHGNGHDRQPSGDSDNLHILPVLCTNDVDPVACGLRVAATCVATAVLSVSAVTVVLVQATSPRGGSRLDVSLNWVIGIPVAALAIVWQLARLGWMAGRPDHRPAWLLAADVAVEGLLAVGSAIEAVLAAFQAARHRAYNRQVDSDSSLPEGQQVYRDVGPEIAVAVLLGCLMLASFGLLALAFVEVNNRRRDSLRSQSHSSSVIEIIRR